MNVNFYIALINLFICYHASIVNFYGLVDEIGNSTCKLSDKIKLKKKNIIIRNQKVRLTTFSIVLK
jgi:hypothetical protein